MATLTVSEFVTKPGIGPVLFKRDVYFDLTEELAFAELRILEEGYEALHGFTEVQRDGSSLEVITGPGSKLIAEVDF